MCGQRSAAGTVANLAINPTIQSKMLMLESQGQGGIFNLIQMLDSSPSLDLKIHAARALFNLSVNAQCREKIVVQRGIKVTMHVDHSLASQHSIRYASGFFHTRMCKLNALLLES